MQQETNKIIDRCRDVIDLDEVISSIVDDINLKQDFVILPVEAELTSFFTYPKVDDVHYSLDLLYSMVLDDDHDNVIALIFIEFGDAEIDIYSVNYEFMEDWL